MSVSDVRIIGHVRNLCKLIFVHARERCPEPVVFGRGGDGKLHLSTLKLFLLGCCETQGYHDTVADALIVELRSRAK